MNTFESSIVIRKATLPEENEYIARCLESDDFVSYIGNPHAMLNKVAYLFIFNGSILGVFWPEISSNTGVVIAMPSIYMTKRMSRSSVICIGKMITELFSSFHVEKILIPIYSNNKSVINMMQNFSITLEGVFRGGLVINREIIDIYYFSILQSEINSLKLIYTEKYDR